MVVTTFSYEINWGIWKSNWDGDDGSSFREYGQGRLLKRDIKAEPWRLRSNQPREEERRSIPGKGLDTEKNEMYSRNEKGAALTEA